MEHICKLIPSPDAFLFFQNFDFLVKRQKMSQNDNQLCLTPDLRNCTSYDCGFWYICVQ